MAALRGTGGAAEPAGASAEASRCGASVIFRFRVDYIARLRAGLPYPCCHLLVSEAALCCFLLPLQVCLAKEKVWLSGQAHWRRLNKADVSSLHVAVRSAAGCFLCGRLPVCCRVPRHNKSMRGQHAQLTKPWVTLRLVWPRVGPDHTGMQLKSKADRVMLATSMRLRICYALDG